MKRFLVIFAVLALLLTGCNKAPDETPQPSNEPVVGGWEKVEDGHITPELEEMFNSAMETVLGVDYTPVELLETQVVAGKNYKFRTMAKGVYPGAKEYEAIVTIYQDLQGNLQVLEIEDFGAASGGLDPAIDFDYSFETFDSIEFDPTDSEAILFEDVLGPWVATLTRLPVDEIHDRELCAVNIYYEDDFYYMDVEPRLRDEDEHISETDHRYDRFVALEKGEVPQLQSGGMFIYFDQMFAKDGHQYIIGRMEIPEINESSAVLMFR